MTEQSTTKAPTKAKAKAPMTHPAMRPRQRPKRVDEKQRRTTVRVAKLINATNEPASLIQAPIEPGHNNAGVLSDPTQPLRFYLNKGFMFPHEYDIEKYPGIYCAVKDCWEWAEYGDENPEGSERCSAHEEMYKAGIIRYATSAREWKGA